MSFVPFISQGAVNGEYQWKYSRKYKKKNEQMSCGNLQQIREGIIYEVYTHVLWNLSSNLKQSLHSVFLRMVTITSINVGVWKRAIQTMVLFQVFSERLVWNYCIATLEAVRRCSMKKILWNRFTKLTEKHLQWAIFLIKLQTWIHSFTKNRAAMSVFCCETCKNIDNSFSIKHLRTTDSVYLTYPSPGFHRVFDF